MLARVGRSRREHFRSSAKRSIDRRDRWEQATTEALLINHSELFDEWIEYRSYETCLCCDSERWGLIFDRPYEALSQSGVDASPENSWVNQLAPWLKATNDLFSPASDEQVPGFKEARRQFDAVKSSAFRKWSKQCRAVARCLLLLHPFWIRSPLDWSPDERPTGESIGLHLLARYPVPTVFLSCFHWDGKGDSTGHWMVWVLLIGQGVSLSKTGIVFGVPLAARLPSLLSETPRCLRPAQAVIWAEARRLGAGDDLARLLASNGWRFDPHMESQTLAEALSEVRQTASWFIRHGDALDERQAQLVLDWAKHRYSEAAAGYGHAFSWRRRTVASVLAHAEAYAQAQVRSRGSLESLAWPSHGWDWGDSHQSKTWTIRELCSGVELAEEGAAMRHCVALYGARCVVGSAAIFSVCCNGVRVVTVEIAPVTLRLIQARGFNDRHSTVTELATIHRWLDALRSADSTRSRADRG